jgi:DNA repair protein RadC
MKKGMKMTNSMKMMKILKKMKNMIDKMDKQYELQEVGLYIKNKIDISKRPDIYDREMVLWIMEKIENFQFHLDYKEMFYVIYVNNADTLLSIMKVSEGSDLGQIVSVKQVIQGALLQNATGMILVHNHPSGNLTPSRDDIVLTNFVRKCANIFDLELIDHIIISPCGSYSFEDGF